MKPRKEVNQTEADKLRENPRYIEYHIRPNERAKASELTKPYLVGTDDNYDYYLMPEKV